MTGLSELDARAERGGGRSGQPLGSSPGGWPGIDRAPNPWTGRVDGSGAEHARWHDIVQIAGPEPRFALIGFACDEGVRRNGGRVGAAEPLFPRLEGEAVESAPG